MCVKSDKATCNKWSWIVFEISRAQSTTLLYITPPAPEVPDNNNDNTNNSNNNNNNNHTTTTTTTTITTITTTTTTTNNNNNNDLYITPPPAPRGREAEHQKATFGRGDLSVCPLGGLCGGPGILLIMLLSFIITNPIIVLL